MPVNPDAIADRLDADRRALLDLSLRNPLLNYRPRKRGLSIVGESPVEIARIMLREGRRMGFEPGLERPEAPEGESAEGLGPLLELPPPDPGDLELRTDVPSDQLQERLLAIDAAARGSVEELGVNTLFLAIGMLRWDEGEGGRSVRAPLILLPVGLGRSHARDRFRVRYTGEDLATNLSLAERLRVGFGIELPELPGSDDLEPAAYFDAVDGAIAGESTWSVDRDAVALGFFSFSRLLMYRDLDASTWPEGGGPSSHPVLSALLGDGFDDAEGPMIDDEAPLDEAIGPFDVRPVLDADGSQMLALADAKAGRTLVIQGPPGTGKSQTIANLIAEAVGRGRSVLFVAEKAAALEVVHRRLDAVGLGAACLELHSNRTRKREVLDELRRTLSLGRPRVGAAEDDAAVLVERRDHLNAFAEAANAPIGASGRSPHEVAGDLLRERAALGDSVTPALDIPGMADWSAPDYESRELLVEQLEGRLADLRLPADHPIRRSTRSIWTPTDRSELSRRADGARSATERVIAAAEALAGALGVPVPEGLGAAEALANAVRPLPEHAADPAALPIDDDAWDERREELDALIEAGIALDGLHARHDATLLPEAWDRDLEETRASLNTVGRRWGRWLSGRHRRALFRLATLCRRDPPRSPSARLEVVDAVMEGHRLRTVIGRGACLASRLFGTHWRGPESSFETLEALARHARRIRRDLRDGRLPAEALGALAEEDLRSPAVAIAEGLDHAILEHRRALGALDAFNGLGAEEGVEPGSSGDGRSDRSFEELLARINASGERGADLHAVALVNQRAAACREAGLGAVVEAARAWPDAPGLLGSAFRARRAEALLDRAARERPALSGFAGVDHETLIDRFAALDVAMLGHNRAWAAAEHWSRLPRRQAIAGDLAVLRRELEKKTRHLPLRVLFAQAGRAVQAIKPVFMMSPLSVAAYLEPGQLAFDLVVFDEASQVRPVDALGALLRGRQAVVVGDDRQLPPTTFFDRLTTGDESIDDFEYVDASITDALESVLGLFLAQGASRRMLRWHYRSRHESLIAVSNREFYDGRLLVFPGPAGDRSELGLALRYLPETIYDRGRSRTNPMEAEAVADAVIAFARAQLGKPEGRRLTLGVAAFSNAQAEAISRRLERRRRDEPGIEGFFGGGGPEPFFVKNLESVQGDERDAIYISIGYGRDVEGKVALNFGPLNGEGGERRLNVLITRARLRCEVFTNLRGADLDAGRSAARGVRALRVFLHYAETGVLDGDVAAGTLAGDSPFEAAVAGALRDEGFEIVRGLGEGASRVDLAVVDPDDPGRYRLGLLCDGPSYDASRSARDRDRIRPSVLRGLGWRLARCWSPDWWHDPGVRVAELLGAIEGAGEPFPTREESPIPGSIARDDQGGPGGSEVPTLPPYTIAQLKIESDIDPSAPTADRLDGWVAEVVRVEGPVHESEVARRIAEALGLKRRAGRPREAIDRAVASAGESGAIRRRGAFLWPSDLHRPLPRDRGALPSSSRRLELVAPEELAAAVERIVSDAFGVAPDDLPAAVCRWLGFPRTTDEMKGRVASLIDDLLADGRLDRQGHRLVLPPPAPASEAGDEDAPTAG